MGKVDDLRAMREAKFTGQPAVRKVVSDSSELCGHRSIGKKSCIRPKGHTEKSHKYTRPT